MYIRNAMPSSDFMTNTIRGGKSVEFHGMTIMPAQGNKPRKVKLLFTSKLANLIKPSLGSNRSIHALCDYQHNVIKIAQHALAKHSAGKFDKSLNALAEQMIAMKFKKDRSATDQEWKAARCLKSDLIHFISRQYQVHNNIPRKEADQSAVITFGQARVDCFNNSPWRTIQNSFNSGGQTYYSKQQPAAEMKLGKQDVFPVSYQGKGVCSAATQEVQHATNLWNSTVSVDDANGQKKLLFSGIRHGTLSPYKLDEGSTERSKGAQARASEVVTAALFSRPEILKRALQGETVPLRLVSTSLLSATNLIGKEGAMVRDQIQAWQVLQDKQPMSLSIRNEQGQMQTVKISLGVTTFSFGVNELSLKFGLGNMQSDKYNAPALRQLLGDNLRPEADPDGWVGEYLRNNPDNSARVLELSQQLKTIWAKQLHHSDHGEPYKAAQRATMLAYEIGAVPCWNCKSGKDRTGMLDVEVKREVIALHQGKKMSELGTPLDPSGQELIQKVLMYGGNMEIQAYNTGAAGNKILKSFSLPSLNLSYQQRIGSQEIWNEAKGMASLVGS